VVIFFVVVGLILLFISMQMSLNQHLLRFQIDYSFK
jgi:hypothetical protein